ncbi:[NiFe]-hydrogenase assembly chaperone HybE [Azohydromonas aeria]|uniref:[NiFe]-hydrogenase assembly chaperone HybE n=1 Tax=Azohydromonas aeria TaxID=2590212 RepID=UPI0012FB026D|nr:[NiFe]-hydrogenase assembly chaperone HybE [Azohydromonas aeria]
MHRVALLAAAYEHIARTRMAGVPLLNAALRTEAVGFEAQLDDDAEEGVLGVLVTPWFMNLVWLPLADGEPTALGATRERTLGGTALPFIGSEAAGCRFEACSLFSPMFEFADPAAARAVAQAVLAQLRRPVAAPATAPALPATSRPVPNPARRGLLFGCRGAEAR